MAGSSKVERAAVNRAVEGSSPSLPAPLCEWCGHGHAITDLCTQRPTWGRRGFLALLGMGLAGIALPAMSPLSPWQQFVMGAAGVWTPTTSGIETFCGGQLLLDRVEKLIKGVR